MRYATAIVRGMFMFVATLFLAGLVLVWVLPPEWSQREVGIGGVGGTLAGESGVRHQSRLLRVRDREEAPLRLVFGGGGDWGQSVRHEGV